MAKYPGESLIVLFAPSFANKPKCALFYAFYSVTGHRQTLATALIVFVGYKYIKEKKLLKFLVIAFIVFMLHKSSLVFIPYYFIAHIILKHLLLRNMQLEY